MSRLIIDTDIGTDIDDALALLYGIKSGYDIALVTTVHGDTVLRAKIAKKLLDYLKKDIPVVAGEQKPLKQTQIFWTGIEGKGFLDGTERYEIEGNAPDKIASTVHENKGDISIACIGPLTNIATAFQRYPDLPSMISRIYVMGNAITTPYGLFLNYRSHNFKADPEAADIVLKSDVPKTVVTTETSKKAIITQDDLSRIEGPYKAALLEAASHWRSVSKYDCFYLYDPLTVAHHNDGDVTKRQAYGNVEITIDVNPSFAKRFLEAIA